MSIPFTHGSNLNINTHIFIFKKQGLECLFFHLHISKFQLIIHHVFRIGRVQYGAGTDLGPRKTIEHEFVRILKGEVQWTYNGQKFSAPPGTWILSQPNDKEYYRWDPHKQTQHDHVHFSLHDLPGIFPAKETWPTIQIVESQNVLNGLFQQVVDLKRSTNCHKKKIWGSYNTRKVMMQWAKRHALLRGFSLDSKNIQIVMDGEVCLAKGFKEIFTEARFTLDIRHLEEYL